jgi:hypothetical protein
VNGVPGARQSRSVTEPQREKARLEWNPPRAEKQCSFTAFQPKRIFAGCKNARLPRLSKKPNWAFLTIWGAGPLRVRLLFVCMGDVSAEARPVSPPVRLYRRFPHAEAGTKPALPLPVQWRRYEIRTGHPLREMIFQQRLFAESR